MTRTAEDESKEREIRRVLSCQIEEAVDSIVELQLEAAVQDFVNVDSLFP